MNECDQPTSSVGGRLRLAVQIVQVRLRFVVVLALGFAVVAGWDQLRNRWDALTHRITGLPAHNHGVSGDTEYFCPMDPGVLSTWPSICPVCNMSLVRRKKGDAVLLPEGVVARMQFSPYRVQLAGIQTSPVIYRGGTTELLVPDTAVIDTGLRQVVYVETMPGMFDGVEVTLGPRNGDTYPVLKGLTVSQRVATTGAFLIDAEARLNPSVAASYFGASQSTSATSARSSSSPPVRSEAVAPKSSSPGATRLSNADQALARQQKVCPVTNLPLDSMGGPLLVMVEGRKIFLCCKGCESSLKKNPQKYLAKLKNGKSL